MLKIEVGPVYFLATAVFVIGFHGAASQAEDVNDSNTVVQTERTLLVDDIYHYTYTLNVGDNQGAPFLRVHRIVKERASERPANSHRAIMLLHGDFANFVSNFVPSEIGTGTAPDQTLAVFLARAGIDVWGLDRRWTLVDENHLAALATMGFASAISDVRHALSFARNVRKLTGSGSGRILLGGFSHGAQLAYEYASDEAGRPARERQIRGLVALDYLARFSPEDETARLNSCSAAVSEYDAVAAGFYESDNRFFSALGSLARSNPDGFDLDPTLTNRDLLLLITTQTYFFFAPTPFYHLAAGVFDNGVATGFRFSPELRIEDWFAASPPFQPMIEGADADALTCGEGTLPLPDHFSEVKIPLLYIGAAGGIGDHGIYSTTLVGSSDVTAMVVRTLATDQEAEDFGHGDVLYASSASDLVWAPLAGWILRH